MISTGGSDYRRAVRLLQHAAGRFDAGNERLDQIFLGLGGIADGNQVLLRIDEDQAVARSVPRRFGDQPAVFGERGIDIFQRDAFRRAHARNRRKALGRHLVERQMRRRRAGPGKGNPAHFAHRLQFAVLRPAAMQAEHQHAIFRLGLVERAFKRDAALPGSNSSSNGRL